MKREGTPWRLFWLAVAALFFVLLVVWLAWRLSQIFLPFVLAFLVAYFFNPAINWFERRGWSRSFSVFMIMLLFLGVIITVGLVLIPPVAGEVADLAENYEPLIEKGQATYRAWIDALQSQYPWLQEKLHLSSQIESKIGEYSSWLVSLIPNILSAILQGLFSFMTLMFLTGILAYWMLKDYRPIGRRLLTYIPSSHTERVAGLSRQVNQLVSSYLLGLFTLCLVSAVVAIILLVALRIPYGFLLGLLTGIGYAIPYFGIPIATAITALVAFATGQPIFNVGLIVVVLIALNLVLDYALAPRIIGERVGLHPLTVIFALLAAGKLFGFIGILIALPLAAAIRATLAAFFPEFFRSQDEIDRQVATEESPRQDASGAPGAAANKADSSSPPGKEG